MGCGREWDDIVEVCLSVCVRKLVGPDCCFGMLGTFWR